MTLTERAIDALDTSRDEIEDPLEALSGEPSSLDEGTLDQYALPFPIQLDLTPRVYQREALSRWVDQQGRGVIVLPTGAGKTVVALMALEIAPVTTLVVVPTLELLRQWRE